MNLFRQMNNNEESRLFLTIFVSSCKIKWISTVVQVSNMGQYPYYCNKIDNQNQQIFIISNLPFLFVFIQLARIHQINSLHLLLYLSSFSLYTTLQLQLTHFSSMISCRLFNIFYNIKYKLYLIMMLPQTSITSQAEMIDFKKVEQYYYQPNQVVGKGNFSHVYRGIDKNNNRAVAIKVIKNSSLTSTVSIQLLKNEISILKQLDSENVIKCLDVFVSQNHHYIVTQYCDGGDLEKLIQNNGFLEEKAISKLIYGIYKGLLYLNEEHVVHRDLKPANIFLTKQGIPKIADFGFAVKHNKLFKDINIGSPIYMSPEGLLKRQYGPKTQVWALGILLYEMLHGYTPLSKCQTQAELREKVLVPPIFRSGVSQEARNFIETCLNVNEKKRLSMQQVSNIPYMNKIIYEFQGIKKDLASTRAFSHSTQNSAEVLTQQVKMYEQGLAILHYCRLIHKTTKQIPSAVLSQWLLNLCWGLQKIKLQVGDKQQNQNLMMTIHNYWMKYYEEHKSKGMIVSFSDVKFQCEQILDKIKHSINVSTSRSKYNNLMVLLRETELLEKFGQSNRLINYAKSSQLQKYLQNLSHSKNSHHHHHHQQSNAMINNTKNNKSLNAHTNRIVVPNNLNILLNPTLLQKDFKSMYM